MSSFSLLPCSFQVCGDRLVLHGLAIDGNAVWRAGLILPGNAQRLPNRVIIEHLEIPPQIIEQFHGNLRHPLLIHQRKYRRLDRGQLWFQTQNYPFRFFLIASTSTVSINRSTPVEVSII